VNQLITEKHAELKNHGRIILDEQIILSRSVAVPFTGDRCEETNGFVSRPV